MSRREKPRLSLRPPPPPASTEATPQEIERFVRGSEGDARQLPGSLGADATARRPRRSSRAKPPAGRQRRQRPPAARRAPADRQQLSVELPRALVQQLTGLCAAEGIGLQEALSEAIASWVDARFAWLPAQPRARPDAHAPVDPTDYQW